MVLPLDCYPVKGWKFLKDHKGQYAPGSGFLWKRFVDEAGDIVLGAAQAEELLDKTEFAIGLEYAHQTGEGQDRIWMPVGWFIKKDGGQWLKQELTRIRSAPRGRRLLQGRNDGREQECSRADNSKNS